MHHARRDPFEVVAAEDGNRGRRDERERRAETGCSSATSGAGAGPDGGTPATIGSSDGGAAGAGTALPVDGAPAQGSVPANLVGTWSHTSYGATDRIVLNADGTGSNFIDVSGGAGGCVTIESSTKEGVTVVSSDFITIYASRVTNVEKVCSAHSMTTIGDPVIVQIAWKLKDPTTLVTVDSACAAKYDDEQASVDSYCVNELTKQ